MPLPTEFQNRLRKIVPKELSESVLQSMSREKDSIYRINTLKTNIPDMLSFMESRDIPFERIQWCEQAVLLRDYNSNDVNKLCDLGMIYKQNLSSILTPMILGPQRGEDVLDLCAAPGSKSTQMAAMMNNKGQIVCVENIKKRMYRLKSVVAHLGAENITIYLKDGRKYRSKGFLFDKILVDAPCSSEGRFRTAYPKTYQYWSLRKINEMAGKQKGLLLNASRMLKPGGTLVYSTCTFAPEENEEAIDWLLTKTEGQIEIVKGFKPVSTYPCLTRWGGKTFDRQVSKCMRIRPDERMDGFFIAKLKKKI